MRAAKVDGNISTLECVQMRAAEVDENISTLESFEICAKKQNREDESTQKEEKGKVLSEALAVAEESPRPRDINVVDAAASDWMMTRGSPTSRSSSSGNSTQT